MFTSVAVLGNAMRALQEAAIIDLHFLEGWPSLPIYLAQATGYYPTLPSVLAQGILLTIYVVGAVVTFVIARRRRRPPALAGDPTAARRDRRLRLSCDAMGVRIGVDVGGTFTKAVGIDMATGEVVARAAVLTTHDDSAGPAAGVVDVVGDVAAQVGAGPRRAHHLLHDPGGERAPRGRRRRWSACSGSAASPTCARRPSAPGSTGWSWRRAAGCRP